MLRAHKSSSNSTVFLFNALTLFKAFVTHIPSFDLHHDLPKIQKEDNPR